MMSKLTRSAFHDARNSWMTASGVLLGVGLVLAGAFTSSCRSESASDESAYRIYVGTGTGDEDEGIHTFRFDGSSGALMREGGVTPTMNPTYLTLSPDGRYLYSVSETGASGSVSAFRVDPVTGALILLNRVPSGGAGPCYISTDASGRWVLAANYGGGSVALFPVHEDGSLGEASDVIQHTGSSTHPERQTGPHAHFIHVGPQNRFAFAADLGIDRLRIYPLDTERGRLSEHEVREVVTSPGTGPRHLAYHPNGRYAYLVSELNGTVTAYRYDAERGGLTDLQTVSTLPSGFSGTNKSADIHVHPSGKYLYASNRGDSDSIVVYAIDASTGMLTLVEHQSEGVQWPRNFSIDPTGRFLLVANRRADNITVYRIDLDTGRLSPTGHVIDVPGPTCIKFAPHPDV